MFALNYFLPKEDLFSTWQWRKEMEILHGHKNRTKHTMREYFAWIYLLYLLNQNFCPSELTGGMSTERTLWRKWYVDIIFIHVWDRPTLIFTTPKLTWNTWDYNRERPTLRVRGQALIGLLQRALHVPQQVRLKKQALSILVWVYY